MVYDPNHDVMNETCTCGRTRRGIMDYPNLPFHCTLVLTRPEAGKRNDEVDIICPVCRAVIREEGGGETLEEATWMASGLSRSAYRDRLFLDSLYEDMRKAREESHAGSDQDKIG